MKNTTYSILQTLKSALKTLPFYLVLITIIVFIIPTIIITFVIPSEDNFILGLIVAITKSSVGTKTKISLKINNDEKKNRLTFIYEK